MADYIYPFYLSALGGTISGSLTVTGDLTVNGSLNFGDVGTDVLTIAGYMQGSAAGTTYLRVGSGTTSHTLAAISDLFVTGKLEVDGIAFFDGVTTFATPIALTSGGTNASLTASNGGIFYSTATAAAILGGTATAGQHLQSGSSAAPSWTTATFPSTATGTGTILRADGTNWVATTSTYPNTNAVNTLLYASSANVMAALATANSGVLVTSGGGVPSIATDIPTAVTIGSAYIYRVGGTDAALADGGTNASLTASNGGIFYSTSTAGAILSGTATAGQIIRSGSSAAPTWSTATYPDTAGTAGNNLRSNGTNFVSVAPATATSTVAGPNTTTSSTAIMGGLSGTITPTTSGRVYFQISGTISSGAASGTKIQLRYGTGTAPTTGAAATGTTVGSLVKYDTLVTAQTEQFVVQGVVTGLTVSTAYWYDVTFQTNTTGTSSLETVTLSAFEL